MVDDAEFQALFERLPTTLHWTMGFLAAIGSGPDRVAPAAWLEQIVGEAELEPAMVDVLERFMGVAGETLRTTPELMAPEADEPAETVVDFCAGYVRAAGMHASWSQDAAVSRMLGLFEVLAKPGADVSVARDSLGAAVAALYFCWQSKHQVVKAAKVGRNDSCPCGSGKKFKRCCLAESGGT